MGKKHKKQLRELQRLQALHQDAKPSEGDFRVETPSPVLENQSSESLPESASAEAESTDGAGSAPVSDMAVHKHNHVKRDLVFLVVLIVVMIAGLIAINWAIDNTALGGWLLSMFGQ